MEERSWRLGCVCKISRMPEQRQPMHLVEISLSVHKQELGSLPQAKIPEPSRDLTPSSALKRLSLPSAVGSAWVLKPSLGQHQLEVKADLFIYLFACQDVLSDIYFSWLFSGMVMVLVSSLWWLWAPIVPVGLRRSKSVSFCCLNKESIVSQASCPSAQTLCTAPCLSFPTGSIQVFPAFSQEVCCTHHRYHVSFWICIWKANILNTENSTKQSNTTTTSCLL